MTYREHIQNMLNGAAKRTADAVEASNIPVGDAQLMRLQYRLDALDGCVKTLADGLDRLLDNLKAKEPHRFGDNEPSTPDNDTA